MRYMEYMQQGAEALSPAPVCDMGDKIMEYDASERKDGHAGKKRTRLWSVLVALNAVLAAALLVNFFGNREEEDKTELFYSLMIGAEGVNSIEVSGQDMGGGVTNANGKAFKMGEVVPLDFLDGMDDLRGVTIRALGEDSSTLYEFSAPADGTDNDIAYLLKDDSWLILPEGCGISVAKNGEGAAVTWTLSPMMSATRHAAFHFDFDMEYEYIEASCSGGILWDTCGEGQPEGKSLSYAAGKPVCWRPDTYDEHDISIGHAADVAFTVYDSGEVMYTGIIEIECTGSENGQIFYSARMRGTERLELHPGDYHGTVTAVAPGTALAELPEIPQLIFASGAGGWDTSLTLQSDGSFTGSYGDSEMGSRADEYPDGTYYICNFKGRFANIQMKDDNIWTMELAELTTEREADSTWIQEGIRYIAVDAYGVVGGEDFILYGPGTPLEQLTEECISWLPDRNITELDGWGLYNRNTGECFFTSWLS